MAKLGDLIRQKTELLQKAGIENADYDARLLISKATGLDRAQLITQKEQEVTSDDEAKINTFLNRRAAREPVARILGEREFWGLPFGLNADTLEPRPDSEILIETALSRVKDHPKNILDLGTGTGCLLLSLLSEWKNAKGMGVDISDGALRQATENAKHLHLDAWTTFIKSHWFNELSDELFFDVIISNPPYITENEMNVLEPEVKNFDPARALDGGKKGLDPYEEMIPQLTNYLNPNGLVILEVGHRQAKDVANLLDKNGIKDIAISKDLGGIERCVSGLF